MSDGLLWYIGRGDAASQRRAVQRGIAFYADQNAGRKPGRCVVHPSNASALLDMTDVDFVVGTVTITNHVYFGESE